MVNFLMHGKLGEICTSLCGKIFIQYAEILRCNLFFKKYVKNKAK